ncbi:sulfotransferase family 2 domain-containing protein [Sphingobium yanoikuyae]|uniref:sulfotransferase family 2 domain-containing protein n=1 Tax=Sphingobium yanoikuyae TaxID=13690 RepID=UPI0028A5F194|nr:sulfotransferase family 2 domain-containing protein [Sphingobium yanoikuyae]
MSAASLFGLPASQAERNAAIEKTRSTFPDHFPSYEAAKRFLNLIIISPSNKWAFMSVGKVASSSILHMLFKSEYGVDLTVSIKPDRDINPDAAVHMLADNQVFSRALLQGISATDLISGGGPQERIVMLRDPMQRAVSAFRYFCLSDDRQSYWFVPDRLRINAALGFDWKMHPNTVEGFRLFLIYISREIERVGVDLVNGHWRPQYDVIKPEVYRPTIVGRMNDMNTFVQKFSDRTGLDLVPMPHANNQLNDGRNALEIDEESINLVNCIYKRDFDLWDSC